MAGSDTGYAMNGLGEVVPRDDSLVGEMIDSRHYPFLNGGEDSYRQVAGVGGSAYLVGDNSESMIRFLPIMQTDIFLRLKEKILIIDAKYYGRTLQHQFDKYTLHSGNVYQIFTYVKNQDKDNTGNVAGILLYAKTDEAITPDCMFNMGGNQIGAKTLDLNTDFKVIAAQLDKIAEDFFHVAAA